MTESSHFVLENEIIFLFCLNKQVDEEKQYSNIFFTHVYFVYFDSLKEITFTNLTLI